MDIGIAGLSGKFFAGDPYIQTILAADGLQYFKRPGWWKYSACHKTLTEERKMKKKLCYIAVLASFIGCAGLSQAATYTMDFDEAVARTSATGVFDIDTFTAIDSASLDFVIRGKTTAVNSRGYWWYYDPNIDLSIIDTPVLDNYHLSGDFTVLHFDLTAAALSHMEANQSVNFEILAQDGFWWSDLSPWGGYTKAPFYLDEVSLQVTPSAVPIPGAVILLGSGLAGLAGVRRIRRQ